MMMSETNMILNGVVVAGHGVASGQGDNTPYPDSALKLQSPHLQPGNWLSGRRCTHLKRFRLRPAKSYMKEEIIIGNS